MMTILKNVTEEQEEQIIRDYETVRSGGDCNMYDYNCVATSASDRECFELVEYMIDQEKKGYLDLLQNYSRLMKKYNVEH